MILLVSGSSLGAAAAWWEGPGPSKVASKYLLFIFVTSVSTSCSTSTDVGQPSAQVWAVRRVCFRGTAVSIKRWGALVRGHGDLSKGIEQEARCPRHYSSRGVEGGLR